MKEYNKFIKKVRKLNIFRVEKSSRRNTVKVTHIKSGKLYSVHPGDKAVKPLQQWIKKFIK